ncbi:MAG: hypothetical protein P8N10_03695 [SAR86 cluster bacterium]|nr:hypothetical protein [SAR86 cluster bacterium]
MKDDDKEFRYTSYPSGLPKIYVEEDEVELEENNEGNIKKLLKRAPLKILLLFMIIGAALTIWIVR